MKTISIASVLSFFIMAVTCVAAEKVSQPKIWPKVRPVQIKTYVTSKNPQVVLDVFSVENPSEKLYELRCNKSDAKDKAEGEDEYYGMFQCHFLPMKEVGPELLIGEREWSYDKDYNTRGVFTYEQLIGPCKNDPEFGFHREFNMRGMKLELTISNFSSPPMADMLNGKAQPSFSFDFEAKVTNNKSATTEYTSPHAKKYCGGYYEVNKKGEAIYHEY